MVPPSGETLPTPQPGTQRVLVVDDNPLNCDLLSRRLRRMGLTRVDCVHYLLALGDVSGKGAEAALCMARTVSLLRATTRQHWRAGQDPAQAVAAILAETNEALAEANDSAQFVTLFLGIADLHADRLSYAFAGHPAPYLCTPGSVQTLGVSPSLPLGVMPGYRIRVETVAVPPHARCYCRIQRPAPDWAPVGR